MFGVKDKKKGKDNINRLHNTNYILELEVDKFLSSSLQLQLALIHFPNFNYIHI